jgi:hypothetical protein
VRKKSRRKEILLFGQTSAGTGRRRFLLTPGGMISGGAGCPDA